LELQSGPNCPFTFVAVHDGDRIKAGNALGRFCVAQLPPRSLPAPVTTSTNKMLVNFVA
jgi:hypothetical protein